MRETPKLLRDALAHSDPMWIWFQSAQAERDEVDTWLVRMCHPLAYEVGTQEWRFRQLTRRGNGL